MVAPNVLAHELARQMEELEGTLAALPGIDPDEVAYEASRAGNTSIGRPGRPKYNDALGIARYLTSTARMLAGVVAEQEERIAKLESSARGRKKS